MAKVVVARVQVANVEAAVSNGAEVDVRFILTLLLQVFFDAVLDRGTGCMGKDNNVDSLLLCDSSHHVANGIFIDPLLDDSDGREAVAVVDHGYGLGEDFLSAVTSVEEHTESVALLFRSHVRVLQDGDSLRLLGKELDGGASHGQITRRIKVISFCSKLKTRPAVRD